MAPSSSEPLRLEASTLIYYKKPVIGDDHERDSTPPVQVIFPTGGFAIAVAAKKPRTEDEQRSGEKGTVASAPCNAIIDVQERFKLRISFVLLGVLNIAITSLLYHNAHLVDTTAVEALHNGIPSPFDVISSERRYVEKVNFAFTLTIMGIGMLSAIFENTTGLSLYSLGIVANFFLGTYSLPYFVFSFRYILDIFMLFVGLVLRSRYMYAFLPLHLHRS